MIRGAINVGYYFVYPKTAVHIGKELQKVRAMNEIGTKVVHLVGYREAEGYLSPAIVRSVAPGTIFLAHEAGPDGLCSEYCVVEFKS